VHGVVLCMLQILTIPLVQLLHGGLPIGCGQIHDAEAYLSSRLGKWAYSLVEYDMEYESLRAVKGQIVANFIVDHGINMNDVCLVAVKPWKLFLDGSVCARVNDIEFTLVGPDGVVHEVAARLEFACTNNQAEYEALASGLEVAIGMGIRNVEAYGDSNLVVQQIQGES
jgi:hypothetical protein